MTTAGTTTKQAAQPRSDADEVMEHIHAIREDFASLASATGKLAAGEFKKQSTRAGNLAETAADKAAGYRDLLTEKVKDHPLAAIGIAALAGLVFASMRRR